MPRTKYSHLPDAGRRRLLEGSTALLGAAGAEKRWSWPVQPHTDGAHLLGTCRMVDDPETSVGDRFHRSHEVKNLFLCDGSSHVSSGRGQPTLTIMALASRVAEHITGFARKGEI